MSFLNYSRILITKVVLLSLITFLGVTTVDAQQILYLSDDDVNINIIDYEYADVYKMSENKDNDLKYSWGVSLGWWGCNKDVFWVANESKSKINLSGTWIVELYVSSTYLEAWGPCYYVPETDEYYCDYYFVEGESIPIIITVGKLIPNANGQYVFKQYKSISSYVNVGLNKIQININNLNLNSNERLAIFTTIDEELLYEWYAVDYVDVHIDPTKSKVSKVIIPTVDYDTLLKRAEMRRDILKSYYNQLLNPDWWNNISTQKAEKAYQFINTILEDELNYSLSSLISKTLPALLPETASAAVDLTTALLYMFVGSVSLNTLIEAISLSIDITNFIYQDQMYCWFNTNYEKYSLMAPDFIIEDWHNDWGTDDGYNVNNIRYLTYEMINIINNEINSLKNRDYDQYKYWLKLEKKYADKLLKVLSTIYGTINVHAYHTLVDSAVSWSSGLLYIEFRQGLESLYILLADTWLYEYTYVLDGRSSKCPYNLETSRTVYWLPAVNRTMTVENGNLHISVKLMTGKHYKYEGKIKIEVYADNSKIYEEDYYITIQPNCIKTIELYVPYDATKNYRVKVYAVEPVIIDNKYTQRLKNEKEEFLLQSITIYDKYFSKIEIIKDYQELPKITVVPPIPEMPTVILGGIGLLITVTLRRKR